jgi:signal transduction histidine kinase
LGYATDALRARLGERLTPEVRDTMALVDERSATLRRDVAKVIRFMGWHAFPGIDGPMKADSDLGRVVRRILEETGAGDRRRIRVTGWKHAGRAVPGQAAHDAIQPVVENALVHGGGKVLLEIHPLREEEPWMTVSDSGEGMSVEQAGRFLDPGQNAPVIHAGGAPCLGLATAQGAARAMACEWRLAGRSSKGLALSLVPLNATRT